LKPLSMLQV